jgi:hypothetical protein
MDGLDALLHELRVDRMAPKQSRTESVPPAQSLDQQARNGNRVSEYNSGTTHYFSCSKIASIERNLKKFVEDLADTHTVLQAMNASLSRRNYRDFMDYYLKAHRLSGYFETELRRMSFRVKKNGVDCSNKDEILSIYEKCPLLDIWRLGNQSIYADILGVLQKNFMRNDLSISVVSSSSHFDIDLDKSTVSARSVFRFVTLKGKSPKRLADSCETADQDKLEIGSAVGLVEVDLLHETLIQRVESPALQVVFDEDLRHVVYIGSGDLSALSVLVCLQYSILCYAEQQQRLFRF